MSTAWRDNGFSVDQQEEWKSTMGYQISDIPKAVTWRNFGFTPAQAKECGVNDPLQLSSFFTNGSSRFRPEEVCAWNASGYKGSDAENWSKYGLRLPDVQACRLLGIV
ncbi:MAG: hypothetical protein FJX95_11110, partial [Bacteroidetes bacterium]|nr:hypothetical protein [Bacteroidota bacterium]